MYPFNNYGPYLIQYEQNITIGKGSIDDFIDFIDNIDIDNNDDNNVPSIPQVGVRIQGGNFVAGGGFQGLVTSGPPENPQNLLDLSFLEINDIAFNNLSRLNFNLTTGLFTDGSNILLDEQVEQNGPIAHDPNFFTYGVSSPSGNTITGNTYEISDTNLNMSMRNYRATLLRIESRNGITIDTINYNTAGVIIPALDEGNLTGEDPFRIGELAAAAFFPSGISEQNVSQGKGFIPEQIIQENFGSGAK